MNRSSWVIMTLWLRIPRFLVLSPWTSVDSKKSNEIKGLGCVHGVIARGCLGDTGATSVSVTDALAERAGLEGGEKVRCRTANGERVGRSVTADEVRIASLRVRDVRVGTGYTGDDSEDALLGQNFLRFFDVQMSGDEMLLRPRK